MITKKMLLLPAAGAMMLCVAACQTAQDVPIPDDPQAKEWGTQIKGSYPDWQSTEKMPEGNAEYNELFNQPAAQAVAPEKKAEENAGLGVVDDGADLTGGEQVVIKEEPEAKPEAKAEAPKKGPANAMISVREDGSLLLNGNVISQDAVKTAIAALAADHGEKSVVVIRTQGKIAPQVVNTVLDMCREAKIGKVKFVRHGAAPAPAKQKAAPRARMRMIVDTATPATEYVVQKGDSLSRISLKFYKNAGYWRTIVRANPQLKDANRLRPGMKIKVPALKRVPAGK